MPTRKITTTILKPYSSTPWSKAKCGFQFSGSYSTNFQIPSNRFPVTANEAGYLEVFLETTEDKESNCFWICTLPDGESFEFRIPSGTGDLTLSFVRELQTTPVTPTPNAIYAYIDSRIALVNSLVERREILTISTTGQTVFNLSTIPASPHLSKLFLNGVKQTYPSRYSINSSVLTWLATLQLDIQDTLEIIYT